ncbi:MAG: protein-glutamate O-methyltransferase CheR [Cyclobacteriaceae bacterium]
MTIKSADIKLEKSDISELLHDVYQKYGYDFNGYSQASLNRRISRVAHRNKLIDVGEMRLKILKDIDFFNVFLEEVTVNVTEMFRDPVFYQTLREKVFPHLRESPFIRIWHAGCSTGEEVYSMAVLLEEEGLLDRCLLYATDINQKVLEIAQGAKYPIDKMQGYTQNYMAAGGREDFSKYYTAKYGYAIFNERLKKRMVFSNHNLVTDQSFNEFNIVICRNVLIYFNRLLQNKVIGLFSDSLPKLGYLALGGKESIRFTDYEDRYKAIDKKQRIWLKVK